MSTTSTIDYNIYYLEMHKKPSQTEQLGTSFSLKRLANPISGKEYIKFYKGVGDAYQWTDRTILPEAEVERIINKDNTHIYALMADNKEVGFTELVHKEDFVELQYFGLFTKEIGKGYGPALLKKSIEKAWSFSPSWIQLNTCDLDHPKALSLYKSVGFEEVRRETRRR